jgi:hypothetical protein
MADMTPSGVKALIRDYVDDIPLPPDDGFDFAHESPVGSHVRIDDDDVEAGQQWDAWIVAERATAVIERVHRLDFAPVGRVFAVDVRVLVGDADHDDLFAPCHRRADGRFVGPGIIVQPRGWPSPPHRFDLSGVPHGPASIVDSVHVNEVRAFVAHWTDLSWGHGLAPNDAAAGALELIAAWRSAGVARVDAAGFSPLRVTPLFALFGVQEGPPFVDEAMLLRRAMLVWWPGRRRRGPAELLGQIIREAKAQRPAAVITFAVPA